MKDLRDQVKQKLTAEYVFKTVEGQQPLPSGWIKAKCPFHTDRHPSFAYNPTTLAWACFAGCGKGDAFTFLMNIWGMDFKETLHRAAFDLGIVSKDKKPPIPEELVQGWADVLAQDEFLFHGLQDKRGLTEETLHKHQIGWWAEQKRVTIPIRDEKGVLVNVRLYNSKKKKWKMLNYTDGDWRYGSPIRIYGADELAANPGKSAILTEGEWDALLLRQEGMLAISSTGGCKSWKNEWSALFANRDLTVIYDCDAEGRKAVEETVLPALSPALSVNDIKSLKVVWLPLEGDKDEKDITDYLVKLGHSADDLKHLIDATEPFTPGFIRPSVITSNRQLRDVVSDAEGALVKINDPPELFLRDRKMAKLRLYDNGTPPGIETITDKMLLPRLSKVADFFRRTRTGGLISVDPPLNVVKSLVADPPELPILHTIATAPVMTPSGIVLKQTGYHPELKIWLHLPPELERLQISSKPTQQEIESARDSLLELFLDFPFETQSCRVHALAFLLLPFVRQFINGPTPLHLVSAARPSSGKTLLVQAAAAVFMGVEPSTSTFPTEEEEARKRITSSLSAGASHVLLDNADPSKQRRRPTTKIDSAPLAAVLTSQRWTDRILGKSLNISVQNLATWSMTANNPILSPELTRRCVPIRLVPLVEQPQFRTGFKHAPLIPWILSERPRLISAALTIAQAWFNAGRPKGNKPLGSFEDWSDVMGGILQVASMDGFLGNLERLFASADEDDIAWREFVEVWIKRFGEQPATTAELNDMCDANGLMVNVRGIGEERSQWSRLGRALRGQFQRVYLGWMILTHHGRRAKYYLKRIGEDSTLSTIANSASIGQSPGLPDLTKNVTGSDKQAQTADPPTCQTKVPPTQYNAEDCQSPGSADLPYFVQDIFVQKQVQPYKYRGISAKEQGNMYGKCGKPGESPIDAEFNTPDILDQSGTKGESVAYLNTSSLKIVSTSGMSLQDKYNLATAGNCTPLTAKLAREITAGYENQEVDAEKRARLDELKRWLKKNEEESSSLEKKA